jgi:hypothetical protein
MEAYAPACHIDGMVPIRPNAASTSGQLVFIISYAVRAGGRTYSLKVVAEPDPRRAEDIVRVETILDEKVQAVGPVPSDCIEAFHLQPGKYTAWRDRA